MRLYTELYIEQTDKLEQWINLNGLEHLIWLDTFEDLGVR